MKKLTLLIMACAVAIMGYAAGGNITYELNGGVTNDYGWTSKVDMLVDFSADYNKVFGKSTSWGADTKPGDIQASTYPNMYKLFDDAEVGPKWAWLKEYILKVATDAEHKSLGALQEGNDTYWRGAVDGFFTNSQFAAGAWNEAPDFTTLGAPAAFMPTWGHGFAGPATYDGTTEIILPAPYKAEATFDGWFATADFSGDRVTSIAVGETGDKTLYAKWTEYVPTIAEVWELEAGVATKAGGTVTLIDGNNVYIQDASGGMLLTFAAAPDVAVGDEIVVNATTAANGTQMKLVDVAVTGKTTGTAPEIQKISLDGLVADAEKNYATFMYEWVQLLGLTVQSYNADGTAVLADDGGSTIKLELKLDQATYPVGTKIDFKGVVGFDTDVLLNTSAANIKMSAVPRPDPYEYPVLEEKYSLTSKWLVSANLDNLGANLLGKKDVVRGMVVRDGKMYFIDSDLKRLTVVDGESGAKLEPVKLESKIFETCERPVSGTYPLNDLQIDNAGNILLGNGVTSTKKPFEVWKINLADGTGTLVLSEVFLDNPDYALSTIRLDAFGVYGDVDGDAIILASNSQAMEVYKWTITGGVVGEVEMIEIDVSVADTYLTNLENPGTAPRVFPLDFDYFYLDGHETLPTLIDMDGNVIDGFYNNSTAQVDTTTKPGAEWKINKGHNGLIEFDMGGEHFFLIAGTNTVGVPPSTFRLYKWADGMKAFSGIQPMWTFPAAGMGVESNSYRSAIPRVEVNEDAGIATLYLYTGENGYGVYEFSNILTGVRNIYNNDAVNVRVDGKTLLLSEEVASVSVYTVTGQLIAQAERAASLNVAERGIYIVKATTLQGETAVHKVLVK